MTTFADFIAPFDATEFKTHYYGKKPLLIRGRGPVGSTNVPNPLPWSRFNSVLALTPYWNEDTLKVFYKNRLALRESYCDLSESSSIPGERTRAPIDPIKVRALLGLGATLVANSIHRVCPDVAEVSHTLQREFAAQSGANVYCSFKQVQAFNTHFDLHDVFAFQSEGEKLWRVYEARADNPVAPPPPGDEAEKWLIENRGKLLFEALLTPGDILYLPRGQYHDALTDSEASLHITYWVKPVAGLSLFKLLESTLTAVSDFRAFLPNANDKQVLADHLARLSLQIDTVLRSPSFAIDVQNHQRSFALSPAGFELPLQRRPQFYFIAKRGDVVRREAGFFGVVERDEVSLGNTYPAVSWLFGQRMFSFEDLLARHAFIDEGELRGILHQLLKIGAIVETEMR